MKEKNIYKLIENLEAIDSLLYSLEAAIETLVNDKANERLTIKSQPQKWMVVVKRDSSRKV